MKPTVDLTILLSCEGCGDRLTLQLPSGEVFSATALTVCGRHFCANCAQTIAGVSIEPKFVVLINGLPELDQVWN